MEGWTKYEWTTSLLAQWKLVELALTDLTTIPYESIPASVFRF